MNEIARLCEAVGADVDDVRARRRHRQRASARVPLRRPRLRRLVLPEGRAGRSIHVGARARRRAARSRDAVERVNERQKRAPRRTLQRHASATTCDGKRVALWGLAFKPRTDDVREAPALDARSRACSPRAPTVVAHDPEATGPRRRVLGDRIELVDDPYDAVKGADALVLVTEWNEYRASTSTACKAAMQAAGRLRRPQHLRPRAHARDGLRVPGHRACLRHVIEALGEVELGATRGLATRSASSPSRRAAS